MVHQIAQERSFSALDQLPRQQARSSSVCQRLPHLPFWFFEIREFVFDQPIRLVEYQEAATENKQISPRFLKLFQSIQFYKGFLVVKINIIQHGHSSTNIVIGAK